MRYDVTGDGWGNNEMSRLARDASKRLKQGDSSLVLPVVAYYGTAVFFWGGRSASDPVGSSQLYFQNLEKYKRADPKVGSDCNGGMHLRQPEIKLASLAKMDIAVYSKHLRTSSRYSRGSTR